MNTRVVVLETNPSFHALLCHLLRKANYEVVSVVPGASVLDMIIQQKPQLLLLNDPNACSQIRRRWPHMSVMVLVTEEKEKVHALDLGADDVIIKPFDQEEFLARVRAHLRRASIEARRRSRSPEPEVLTSNDGKISIDVARRIVLVRGQQVRLTPTEFALLWQLMLHTERVLTSRTLLQRVWGPEYIDEVDYVRIYIHQLRCKIEEKPALPRYILTEPGVGYTFQRSSS